MTPQLRRRIVKVSQPKKHCCEEHSGKQPAPPLADELLGLHDKGDARRSASLEPGSYAISNKGTLMETRRRFVGLASAGLGALLMGSTGSANAQAAPPLIDQLERLCRRLAPLGWRQMMLAVTGGRAGHHRARPCPVNSPSRSRSIAPILVSAILRSRAHRGIEPGRPDESLLYHAFAAPTVVSDPEGRMLGDFPTIAEIEIDRKLHLRRARCHAGRCCMLRARPARRHCDIRPPLPQRA